MRRQSGAIRRIPQLGMISRNLSFAGIIFPSRDGHITVTDEGPARGGPHAGDDASGGKGIGRPSEKTRENVMIVD